VENIQIPFATIVPREVKAALGRKIFLEPWEEAKSVCKSHARVEDIEV